MIWQEVTDKFADEILGVHIQGYLTDNPDEEGKVLATIRHGIVTYRDMRASTDEMAQKVILKHVKAQIIDCCMTFFEQNRINTL